MLPVKQKKIVITVIMIPMACLGSINMLSLFCTAALGRSSFLEGLNEQKSM